MTLFCDNYIVGTDFRGFINPVLWIRFFRGWLKRVLLTDKHRSMALTKDERMWLDEKFVNLHKRLERVAGEVKEQAEYEKKINDMRAVFLETIGGLRTDIEKRPTLIQLLSAVAVAFGLGISFAALFVHWIG